MPYASHCHLAAERTPPASRNMLAQLRGLSKRQMSADIASLTQPEAAALFDAFACVRALVHHAWAVEDLVLPSTEREVLLQVLGPAAPLRRARAAVRQYQKMSDGFRWLVTPCQASIACRLALR